MSKKKQKPILSDKIAELIAPRRLLDPEIDSEDETTARAIDYELDEDEETETVTSLSDIRRKNVKLLHDVDAKYRGKLSSRNEFEMEFNSNESEENDGDEDDNSNNEQSSDQDVEANEKSIGEFSMALTPRQRLKLAANNDQSEENDVESAASSEDEDNIKAFAAKLNKSSSKTVESSDDELDMNRGEEVEKWDDDYEGEDFEEEQSAEESMDGSENGLDEGGEEEELGSDEEESDFDGGDMIPKSSETEDASEKPDLSRILPKQQTDNQLNKGVCVQNQLQIWEKLLEVRIHSQKMLIKANSLPQPQKFEELTQKNADFSELANDTVDKVSTLVSQMRDLQSLLLRGFSETREIALKRKPLRLGNIDDVEVKRSRLGTQLNEDYSNFKDYQYSVISKWHDRTKVLTPGSIKTQKQLGNIDVLRKIEGVLANRDELIKKSQLLKGGYELFDKHTGSVESKTNGDSTGNNNEDGEESIYSVEVYDDTDFYHTQLRELIEYKTSASNSANEMAKQFAELQKLRKKMKKTVDTRASKGRKIRYVVHNKLVSFMAPNDSGNWTDEQKDELFKSLFGAQL